MAHKKKFRLRGLVEKQLPAGTKVWYNDSFWGEKWYPAVVTSSNRDMFSVHYSGKVIISKKPLITKDFTAEDIGVKLKIRRK